MVITSHDRHQGLDRVVVGEPELALHVVSGSRWRSV